MCIIPHLRITFGIVTVAGETELESSRPSASNTV